MESPNITPSTLTNTEVLVRINAVLGDGDKPVTEERVNEINAFLATHSYLGASVLGSPEDGYKLVESSAPEEDSSGFKIGDLIIREPEEGGFTPKSTAQPVIATAPAIPAYRRSDHNQPTKKNAKPASPESGRRPSRRAVGIVAGMIALCSSLALVGSPLDDKDGTSLQPSTSTTEEPVTSSSQVETTATQPESNVEDLISQLGEIPGNPDDGAPFEFDGSPTVTVDRGNVTINYSELTPEQQARVDAGEQLSAAEIQAILDNRSGAAG